MLSGLPGYELREMLHGSSRSTVYRARRVRDGAPVVIKVLRKEHPLPAELTRFRQEYDLLCSVPVPGVIRAHGLEPYQDRFALVTEDYGAISLAALLRARALRVDEALVIARQLAEALGEVHRRGIIHKDINPNNVVLHPETLQARLIDFGIATALSRESLVAHNPHVLEGTLPYLSPEQTGRMNRAIDYRSDFYSLGITLYEMLTGTVPFRASEPLELIHQHIAREPVPPHQVAPGVPPVLSRIVLKLMAKTAEERYRSAYGIKTDLTECLTQWRASGHIEDFELARRDPSDKFQVPQKLYGREQELNTLLTTFERVSGGKAELLLVAGYSGVGKSALVNEVQKPIIQRQGHFASGKFDQLQRDVPYASLLQAFQGLVRQLLTENEEQLASWRRRLLAALGDSGRVITEVLPEVELIIGAPPPVPLLPPAEAQHRFNFLFQNFISVMASPEHPLVLFLDDLQWADTPSLKLLQVLLGDSRVQGLLIIGAYRDNEILDAHPLRLTVEALQKAGACVSTLEVKPLGLKHVTVLVADALCAEPARVQELARLVLEKTGGNPFFLGQFLQALHEEKLLTFEPEAGEWRWSLEEVRGRGFTDNVVELMVGKLQRLPAQTQRGLLLAACIGNHFELETLATVAQSSLAEVGTQLWPALEEGLLIPLDPAYRLLHRTSEAWSVSEGVPNMAFRFLHDRVQQAAYSLIAEGDRSGIHLKVGRLLLSQLSPKELEEGQLFDVVNQLNVGLELISSRQERDEVARLNLLVGRKAKASAAYEPARRYLTAGLRLLADDAWAQNHALTFALYTEAMEAEFLCADFERSWHLSEVALAHAATLLERVKVYELRLLSHAARSDGYQTVLTAFEALELLGISLPSPQTLDATQAQQTMRRTAGLLTGRSIAGLLDLPEMSDPVMRAAMRLLRSSAASAHNSATQALPAIVYQMVELSLLHGNAPESIFGYSLQATLMAMMDDIDTARALDDLSMRLAQKLGDKANESKAVVAVFWFVRHRTLPLRSLLDFGLEAIRKCIEVGDAEFFGNAASMYCLMLLLSSEPLEVVESECRRYMGLVGRMKHARLIRNPRVTWQMTLNLMGRSEDPCLLVGEAFDERTALHSLPAESLVSACHFYIFRALLCYLHGDPARAVAACAEVEKLLVGVQSVVSLMWHHFIQCLALLTAYPALDAEDQRRALVVVDRDQKRLEGWAKHAPANYLHLLQLVQAERARAEGHLLEAMEAYEQAIQTAARHRYVHVEALAYERCAGLYLSLGRARLAETYLVEARYHYVRWGATAKVAAMDRRFPGLASRMEVRGFSTSESVSITTSSGRDTLDLHSVLKAARAISSEITLDKLLATLMHTVVENAGAERGLLLLADEERLVVQAQWHEGDAQVLLGAQPPGGDARLSMGIVNYVARARRSVILGDASAEGLFTADAYVVAHRPKSILAVPLVNQDRLVAIIYLENNLSAGAFTADRLQVLELLLAQAALSIHNARLYRSLEDYSHTLERKVEQRTRELSVKNEELDTALRQLRATQRQLVTQEKLASLGALTAGIAHELKNPLNFVTNFAETALELADEVHEKLQPSSAPLTPGTRAEVSTTLDTLRESVERIFHHGQRADSIIKGMLQHAPTSRGRWEPTELNALVSESLGLARTAMRAKSPDFDPEIQLELDAATGVVESVRGDLSRVFLNLIENAYHAMRQKILGPAAGYTPRLLLRTTDLGERVQVCIRDNGVGIPPDVASRLYEPFFTTKPPGEGTGLGLSLSRDIVVGGHGGELTYRSVPGEFTEFLLTLPKRASSTATQLQTSS